MFFFEKKNQKSFTRLGSLYPERPQPNMQKFFASFFQKGSASLRRQPPPRKITQPKPLCAQIEHHFTRGVAPRNTGDTPSRMRAGAA
jgi:hypothetical protein